MTINIELEEHQLATILAALDHLEGHHRERQHEALQAGNKDNARDHRSEANEAERVRSHLEQFREALESGALVGRRLEFLAQELHREANTMASKNADTQLLQHVLELRIWVDRVREQAANVE